MKSFFTWLKYEVSAHMHGTRSHCPFQFFWCQVISQCFLHCKIFFINCLFVYYYWENILSNDAIDVLFSPFHYFIWFPYKAWLSFVCECIIIIQQICYSFFSHWQLQVSKKLIFSTRNCVYVALHIASIAGKLCNKLSWADKSA